MDQFFFSQIRKNRSQDGYASTEGDENSSQLFSLVDASRIEIGIVNLSLLVEEKYYYSAEVRLGNATRDRILASGMEGFDERDDEIFI